MTRPSQNAEPETPVRRVAVISTGVIGTSWVSHYLARGLDVIAHGQSPGAENRLRIEVDAQLKTLSRMGLADDAAADRLEFAPDVQTACAHADFVQENGPESEDVKAALMRAIDAATPPAAVIASSTSGLLPTTIAGFCTEHPERVLVGHPFNPPHLIPLVEVVPGRHTAPDVVERAMSFYTAVGKRPILVRQELPGHVANRLQAALWREAYSLVDRGAASVSDIDAAIAYGPGLRWAILGPFVTQHLSGGAGGLSHLLAHLGPPMVQWWDDLRQPELTPELIDRLVAGVDAEIADYEPSTLIRERDAVLGALLSAKDRAELP